MYSSIRMYCLLLVDPLVQVSLRWVAGDMWVLRTETPQEHIVYCRRYDELRNQSAYTSRTNTVC